MEVLRQINEFLMCNNTFNALGRISGLSSFRKCAFSHFLSLLIIIPVIVFQVHFSITLIIKYKPYVYAQASMPSGALETYPNSVGHTGPLWVQSLTFKAELQQKESHKFVILDKSSRLHCSRPWV
jgi:hypothetical protein